MPYRISKGGGSCGKAQFAVLNSATGKTMGCHTTKASATKQLAALNINVVSKEAEGSHMPEQVREVEVISEAGAATMTKSGRTMLIQLIDPGWGTSGYYSPAVLEAAATDKVFPAGTHMYLDHPTESEEMERPERSVKDLAAVLTTDAMWTGDGLVGEATVFGPYRAILAEMKDAIGISIRAAAMVTEGGEADGRRGRIIDQLVEATSVDFVTHAGRGGKVLQVLESARAQVVESAVFNGVAEATANEIRDRLYDVLKDTYGGEKSWVWVRDFDQEHVWYQLDTPDSCETYELAYAVDDDGNVTISGDPLEVRMETTFVPATRPDSTTTTKESQEDTMPKIEIDEAEHKRLVELAGRVDALEAERDTEKARADQAQQALTEKKDTPVGPRTPRQVLEERDKDLRQQVATLNARERARDIINAELAEAWLAPSTIARLSAELLESLPLVNDSLDEAALRTRCVEKRDQHELEAAEALDAAGVGAPRGLGAMSTPAHEASAAKHTETLTESFKALGLSDSAAEIAVKGR